MIYVSHQAVGLSKDGSKSNPYETLEEAKVQVRELIQSGFKGHIMVNVAPGKYFFKEPLVFGVEDCGNEDCTVTYQADQSSTTDIAELSGAQTLQIGNWEDDTDQPHIKVAQLDKGLKIDGFIVNKEHQILCRYPNYVEDAVPLGSATSVSVLKNRVKNYTKVTGGYIRALHAYKWGGNSYKILEKDESTPTGLRLEWVGDNNRGSHFDEDSLVIENIREELDAPNEWYYDPETGKLYFYPGPNIDLENAVCEGVMTSEIFKFIGNTDGDKIKNIVIDGFHFTNTKRTLFTIDEEGKSYVPLLRGDWCVVRSGAISIQDAKYITLKNLTFNHIGGNGIFLSGYNKNHIIDNNTLKNIGASAIQVVGLPESVYEPSFWNHDHFLSHTVHKTSIDFKEKIGPKAMHYPHEITISNNHIYNVGIFEKQSSGINLSISRECTIIHNTIHKSPRSCININDGTFGGHEIAYNDIFDSQRETTDHGPFNSWGRDRFWSVPCYNAGGHYGEEIRKYALLDAIEPIKLHDNRFHHGADQAHTWGIDLDDGSSHYEIYNNLCLGLGVKLREGFDRKVFNNIFIGGHFNIHCTYAKANDRIYRNIVIGNQTWEFAGQEGGDEKRITEGLYDIDYNSYYSPEENLVLPDFFSKYNYDSHGTLNLSPQFKNTSVNDYTVENTTLLEQTGFVNFPMNQYGKPNCQAQSPCYIIDNINRFEKRCEDQWLGATITTIDEGIISSTASNGYNGVYFKSIQPNSKAYELGFREMDIVKKINHAEITTLEDFVNQMEEAKTSSPLEIEIFRRTATSTLIYTP